MGYARGMRWREGWSAKRDRIGFTRHITLPWARDVPGPGWIGWITRSAGVEKRKLLSRHRLQGDDKPGTRKKRRNAIHGTTPS